MTETPKTPTELDRAWDDKRLADFTMHSRPKIPAIQLMASYRAIRGDLAEKQNRIDLARGLIGISLSVIDRQAYPGFVDVLGLIDGALSGKERAGGDQPPAHTQEEGTG
jgi:hypothetical protein